jgi:hypothetical protein
MTPIDLNIYLFIAAALVFAWVGFSSAKREHSVNDYFHHSDLNKNAVSLTATNITLGTGLVYLVRGAQQNGLLMLLPVLCVGVGYWLLALFLERATVVTARRGKNFLASVDEEISRATGTPSLFAKCVSASLIFVFVLLLAFEIFASAKVISPFLFKTPVLSAEVVLSTVIFCVTVVYTLLGGVRATFGVDIVQVPLICLFLPVFLVSAIPDWNHPSVVLSRLEASLNTSPKVLLAVGIACVNSLATQFYSILNWGAVSNVELDHQQKLLRRVGWATTAVISLFVLTGILHPKGATGDAWQDLVQHLSAIGQSTDWISYLLSGIITLGMTSILLTTTDAVVVNCLLFAYDNLLGGNSKAMENDRASLRKIRLIGAGVFGICFAVLCAINYLQPDPFYLLLSMAGGVAVFAPLIVTAGYLVSRPKSLRVLNNSVVLAFFGLFLVSGIADVVLLSQRSSLVPYIGLSAFATAALLCLSLLLKVRPKAVKFAAKSE